MKCLFLHRNESSVFHSFRINIEIVIHCRGCNDSSESRGESLKDWRDPNTLSHPPPNTEEARWYVYFS